MRTEKGHETTNRPSARFKRPLSIERFEKIRDAQLALGAEEMNVGVFDACNRMITRNMEVSAQQKELAWERLQNRIVYGRSGKFRHPVLRYAIIAIVSLMLIGGVCLAAGWLSWIVHISWDDEQLHVDFLQHPVEDIYLETEHSSSLGIELVDALKSMDIYVPLPQYVPERYALYYVDVGVITKTWQRVTGHYRNEDDGVLIISVDKFSMDGAVTMDIEKDERELEHYISGDIEYIIYENLANSGIYWKREPYVVNITGELTREEIIQMIDSIGG